MHIRLLKSLQAYLPDVDIEDFEASHDYEIPTRQFAPEYSQNCYLEMMKKNNKRIGNYLTQSSYLQITPKDRDLMMMTIQYLHRKKDGYKHETMHLAGNIADRYLLHCARNGKIAPNMTALATTAILMAAKIEQPISPSFNRMISLLPESQRGRVNKTALINLEEQIVWALDFDFIYASPITFLERYQRLFAVDQEAHDTNIRQIGHTAR